MEDLFNIKRKVNLYQEILGNTIAYRKAWYDELKDRIVKQLQHIIDETELEATIDIKDDMENLEAILFSLGQSKSGIYQKVNDDVRRPLIKHNGSLVYQQLFNGKVIVLITYPLIEGYGQPQPPKTIAIYRPEEIQPPFVIRHFEDFLKEITNWEDYDDDDKDQPHQKIGFKLNFMDDMADGQEKA